ncbi:hypothetical protein KIK15_13645 [Williamsia sp. CHRR-6]|nr:hypothetical protein [Williamsia sp. CHRR-6]
MTVVVLVLLLLSAVAMTLGLLGKLDCAGGPYDALGRTKHWPVSKNELIMPCYSDIQFLWLGRDINNHVFPYIHGGITDKGVLFGGAVEYPVLSGLLMYIGAIGAQTDNEFLVQSAFLLAPFGFLVSALLGWLSRWRALLWAATPPLILYAFHNWELPVVATSVAAVAVMVFGAATSKRTGAPRMSLRARSIVAALLLAVGFCLKIYPGLFVVPLALYVLTRAQGPSVPGGFAWPRTGTLRHRWTALSGQIRALALDWWGAAAVLGSAAVAIVAIQLPFLIPRAEGWKASLRFQSLREANVNTNTFWYWGFRHLVGGRVDARYSDLVGILSPLLIAASFVLAIALGLRVWRRGEPFPWIGVSAAVLAGFMLFHKVHSPQYTLWILPFFVLLRIRWPIVVLYLLADFALDTTIFRLFGIYQSESPMQWWVLGGVQFGVWMHAVLLALLVFVFVTATPAIRVATPDPQADSETARRRRNTNRSRALSSTPPPGSS